MVMLQRNVGYGIAQHGHHQEQMMFLNTAQEDGTAQHGMGLRAQTTNVTHGALEQQQLLNTVQADGTAHCGMETTVLNGIAQHIQTAQ